VLGFRVLLYTHGPIMKPGTDSAWQAALEREAALRQEVALLQQQWLGRQAQCPVVATRSPEPPSPSPVSKQPATVPTTVPGTPLTIPDTPKNMKFLSGCWRSVTSLVERRTNKPIEHEYCFDDSGHGEVVIRSERYVCTGKISAAMQEERMLIIKTLGRVPCTKNDEIGNFYAWQAVCQSQADGKALCQAEEETKIRFDFVLLRK